MLRFIPTSGPRPGFYDPVVADKHVRKSREVPVNSGRIWDRSGTPTRRTRTAIHEASHAIVHHRYGHKIDYVTIKPGTTEETKLNYLGRTVASRGLSVEMLVVLFAGSIGETIAFNEHNPDGCRNDKKLINMGEILWGHLEPQWRGQAMLECCKVLRERWGSVEAVAESLLEFETLSGDQINTITAKAEKIKRTRDERYARMRRRMKFAGMML
jgi:hypothetical protein